MNSNKIKNLILTVIFFTTLGFTISTQIESPDDIKGKPYHEGLECTDCHADENPTTFPADFVCVDCHDLDELVATTSRSEEDKWQNPHNNLHFGKDVPCMECHGEHQQMKPLCEGCHSFD